MNFKSLTMAIAVASALLSSMAASATERFISYNKAEGSVVFTSGRSAIRVEMDENDYSGVRIAANNLISDIDRSTGVRPNTTGSAPLTITVGTIDRSAAIKQMVSKGVISAKELKGKTEKYIIRVDEGRIVIAGSDQRGAIYGIYELCEQLGVSPWAWWADVPVICHNDVFMKPGTYTDGEPAVRYRGIFLNDEAPCLTTWVLNTYGTKYGDHRFYARVFELLLRLRANMIWPAMWSWAFYADDPQNGQTARDMGIIVGTSHHEPMARNHQEWARHRQEYGKWNYDTNQQRIDQFFREGMERAKGSEDIITIGMRGDGDEAMSENTDTKLLERIVDNQRKIITEVTGRPAKETPQVWALYKEVLDYYDAGMRVPDDVIMLLCDDNWGQVRRLPNAKERQHKGGWGMYYHVDYVGAPRNSKWICNTPIQNMWEQLTLTYDYGVDKLWILNVGDLKPMEYSISEFLNLAWEPHRYTSKTLMDHPREWCAQQLFNGAEDARSQQLAAQAADILNTYLKYNGRVTAEMLDARTYDVATGEWAQVVNEYKQLELKALQLYLEIDEAHRDAYRQIILFPVQAMSNIYEMYYAQAMNAYLFAQGNPEANAWADRVEECFNRDAELNRQYNKDIANGKWDGMMIQKHIGYTSWNDSFPRNMMPKTQKIENATDGVGQWVFSAKDGFVSMEAEHWFSTTAPKSGKGEWTVIEDMGRTLSGVALMPYTESTEGASMSYRFNTTADDINADGSIEVRLLLKSNLAFARPEGHRFMISIDGGAEQEVNYNEKLNEDPANVYSIYYPTVARRVIDTRVKMQIDRQKTEHTLTVRPIEPGCVFEKFIISLKGQRDRTYLGSAESPRRR